MILLVAVFFVLGLAGGAYWHYRSAQPGPVKTEDQARAGEGLSDPTKAVLQRLNSPVEIRFYSLLDPASVSGPLRAFAGRVDQLLSEYEREAGGMIRVVPIDSMSRSNADAAVSDGMQPFNLDKGDACFLGIAVAHGQQTESLPQLSPEWEQAVDFDLTRAIIRSTSPPAVRNTGGMTETQQSAIDAVRRAVPDLASIPVEEGTRILREAALTEFAAAAKEMERQIAAAQQRLVQAQSGGSEADRQTAMKELQRIQAEHSENLKRIAQALDDRIAALEQLKGVSRQPAGNRGVRPGDSPTR